MKHLLFLAILLNTHVFARVVEYDLTVAETTLAPAGKPRPALTINGGIPGPTLRFTEGDTARIRVHNRLSRGETSMHWHGILLPNREDGVPGVTTRCIFPGDDYTFEFPIRQAGTYWYHSHTGTQEQAGVYGSIVITPRGGEKQRAAADHVLVLSDWSNERPGEIMRTLMRGMDDFYPIKKGTKQSLLGAARAGKLRDFFRREKARLPEMDVSDVAYDAFLINGQRRVALDGRPGDAVRLRLINAGASTYFYVESATGPLRIVAADGLGVQPIQQRRLLIGNGETYDVLVKIPPGGAWEVRATAQDGSGHASAWLGSGDEHLAPDVPRPDIYSMNQQLAAVLDQLDETGVLTDAEALAQEKPRPLPPARRLRATASTEFSRQHPIRTITLKLQGDMQRYLWTFDGKRLEEADTIPVQRGEVLRMELINNSMMHHPVHLHGHFFRVLLGQGKFSPLKHTLDLPPMSRRTIEFLADAQGDWLFHCHVLYHMMAGMSRVITYTDQDPDLRDPLCAEPPDPFYLMAEGSAQTHMSMGMVMLMNARNTFALGWELGRMDGGVEYEVDLTYARYLGPNLSAFAGLRLTDMEDESNRAIAGIHYRLPGNFDSTLMFDSEANLRVALSKTIPLTTHLSAFGRVEYDTNTEWSWSAGATWALTKQFSLIGQYDSDWGLGGGVAFRF